MTFFQAVRNGFINYATFTGRARRSALWWFLLFYLLVSIAAGIVDGVLRSPVLGALVGLAFFLPILALEVRRLHDTDRSGWWVLIGLIPLVGAILLIVWWCQEGTGGGNRFGADPKRAGPDLAVFDAPPPTPTRLG